MRYFLVVLFIFSMGFTNLCYADPSISGSSSKLIELTAAVPVIKMRQGEDFKLFDGIGAGLKLNPWVKSDNENINEIHFSGLVMISSSSEFDNTNTGDTDQISVFSLGLVAGYKWFQIGIGRDFISSESKDSFDDKDKTFYLLNLGANFSF